MLPAPQAPATDAQIFTLARTVILELLSGILAQPVAAYQIESRNADLPGVAAEKMILGIACTTADGATHRLKLFWKRMYGLDIAEAHQYGLLQAHHIPVPSLLGVAFGSKEEEIIVLEVLDAIGIDAEKPAEVRALISTLAKLNGLRLRSEDSWKPPPHLVGRTFAGGVEIPRLLQLVWDRARSGTLGAAFQAWCQEHDPAAALSTIILHGRRLQHMAKAILHEDYAPANTGWRQGRSEHVVFDLHRISIGPRFWDAVYLLGTPEAPRFGCVPWRDQVEHYLSELSLAGGPAAPFAVFQEEARIIAPSQVVDHLKWQVRDALFGPTGSPDAQREADRRSATLLGTLQHLLATLA